MKPRTAKDITVSLYWSLRGASQLLIPRYTPSKWWECDMWRLTKADFVDEYEIKMSVADFRADLNKCQSGYEIDPVTKHYRQKPPVTKHSLLATDERGPNRFWFVVPQDIQDKIEVPPYAGLLVFGSCSPCVVRQAPKRHGRKWDGNKLAVFSTFYHRYWNHEAGSKEEIRPSAEPIADIDASYGGPYPRQFICPDCASELEPSEIGEHDDRCAECAKKADRHQTQADAKAKKERDEIEAAAKKENDRLAGIAEAERQKAATAARIAREEKEKSDAVIAVIEAKAKEEQRKIAEETAAEIARIESAALAPEKEKLTALAATVRAIVLPTMTTEKGLAALAEIEEQVTKFARYIEKKAATL